MALPADVEKAVQDAVASGEYASADDAIEGAMREWKERRENWGYTVAELRAEIQKGIDSGPGDFVSIEEIRVEARRRFARRSS